MGGAERLWLGLQQHLNAVAGHDCELIKVPVREGNLLELVRAYRSFAELDLSHYDRVISTKYPAWAVSHPATRSICSTRSAGSTTPITFRDSQRVLGRIWAPTAPFATTCSRLAG